MPHSEEGGRGTHTPGLQLGAGINRLTNTEMFFSKLIVLSCYYDYLTDIEMNISVYINECVVEY